VGAARAADPVALDGSVAGRVVVTISGVGELSLDDLVDRTVAVANRLAGVTG
jgi:hypothetical protein